MQNTFSQSGNDSEWFLTKIIFQNRYVALETGLNPTPLHGKCHLKFPFWFFEPLPYKQTINENAAILVNMGSPPLYPHPFHPSGSGLIHASVRKESISLAIICFAKKTISFQHQAFRLKNWFKICLQRTRPKIVCQFYTLCRVIILRIKIFQRLWGKNKEN